MAATYVPVTPEVLEWAMAQSGVDPVELADRARTDPDDVLEWLSGDAQPTKTQFRAIVSALRRPEAFFRSPGRLVASSQRRREGDAGAAEVDGGDEGAAE